nr:MIC2 [Eimeria intestinalis]
MSSQAAGVALTTEPDQVCTSLLDVYLLVDESGSIGTANYNKVRSFLSEFILSMPVSPDDVRIGLLTYSTKVQTHWTLDNAKASNSALGSAAALKLPYLGGVTYTHLGLQEVHRLIFDPKKGARNDAPKLLLLMTDGISNHSTASVAAADELRNQGVIIVTLGVGNGVYVNECRSIVGCPATGDCPRFLHTDWAAVTSQVNSIIHAACRDLAKDAICSEWSDFGPCEGECGTEGRRTSSRVELQPPRPGTPPCPTCPAPQGRTCEEQGPGLVRTEPCETPACKVDAYCGDWNEWTEWSGSCGSVSRQRERIPYNSPPASGGGLSCAEQNPPKFQVEHEFAGLAPCPVQQQPGPWAEWSECSVACGGGQRHRERKGIPQEGELYGGQNLESQGISVRETEPCNEQPCPVNADCGDWSEYSTCTRSCGGGTQERRREPWLDNAQHGGLSCIEQHPEGPVQIRECNTDPCPVDAIPGEWEPWGPCTPQCGPGVQTRYRGENKQDAMYGGRTIDEQNKSLSANEQILMVETRECENNPC